MKEMNNEANLNNFFETNDISMELSELFEEFQEEKNKASALKSALSETLECYEGEEGERIIARMTAYYLALNNGIKPDAYRKSLEKLTEKKIQKLWGEDAETVIDVLNLLLSKSPAVSEENKEAAPKKKKEATPKKLGSKNWNAGDLFAYRLKGRDSKSAGIDGFYAIIYCVDVKKISVNKNSVLAYLLLCFDRELPNEPQEIIEHSAVLPSGEERGYLQLLESLHNEYPDDKLRYIGNLPDIIHPENEVIHPNQSCYPCLLWVNFEHRVVYRFELWKKYGEGQEKFLK